jgi:hypothetical protein
MKSFVTYWRALAVLIAIIAAGVFLGWINSPSSPLGTRTTVSSTSNQQPLSGDAAPFADSSQRNASLEARGNTANQSEPLQTEPAEEWEERFDRILTAETNNAEKAKQLLALFPHLPEAGQIEAAQQLSFLVPDQEYPAMDRYLTNSALPDPVLGFLLAGTLNRPNEVRIPLLLEVARDGQNPKAAEARDFLRLFTGRDYGEDWNRWQTGMDQWVRENRTDE